MLTHHTQIWNAVNNSVDPIDFVRYGISGDTPKDLADLNVTVKNYNDKKLEIAEIANICNFSYGFLY